MTEDDTRGWLVVNEDALESRAIEWMFHASHFGIMVEIGNGRWTSEQVTDMPRGVLALLAEKRRLTPTAEEKAALLEIRERLERIVSSNLLDDPHARVAKTYLDRLLGGGDS